jgi:hypothetical protein
MRTIKEVINESKEWNPNGFKSHRDAYNSFIKWYDKQLKYMNEDEIVDMLKVIIQDIKDHELNELKG